MPKSAKLIRADLNRANRAMANAKFGDVLYDLLAAHNALVAKYNALVAKLDADAGVTDTTYTSLTGAPASATVVLPEAR